MTEQALPLGSDVTVQLDGTELTGYVRHITCAEAGFLAGIEFSGNDQWSAETFRPRHLLDPEDMFPVTL